MGRNLRQQEYVRRFGLAKLGTNASDYEVGKVAVVVVQGDALSRSRIATVLCVPLTSNLKWAKAPGNILLTPRRTGLAKDSVANVSQMITLDKNLLTDRTRKLSRSQLDLLLSGMDVVLGR